MMENVGNRLNRAKDTKRGGRKREWKGERDEVRGERERDTDRG